MIITVTFNPSLDRTVEVDRLERGQVLRTGVARLHPGGKGVNVTRALAANGVPSIAVLPVGRGDGEQLVARLAAEGVDVLTVPISGRTRSNITVAEVDGTATKLNEPGPVLTPGEIDDLVAAAVRGSQAGDWVVLCGSLPPGASEDQYARTTSELVDAGLRVAVDTSGPALRLAIGAGPDLIKPNAEELAEAVGRPLLTRADVVAAADELRSVGARRVLVSLGGAGALLVDDDGVTVGTTVVAVPRSTVGAGDAFLAGFLAASARSGPAALANAIAWGSAAVRLPGTQMPAPGDIDPAAARIVPTGRLDALLAEPLVGAT